jgi:hypothetical protein
VVDIFEEVETDLRAERYKELARRLLPWVIGGLIAGVLLVAGIIAYQKYRENLTYKASDAYAQGLKALEAGDGEAAFRQFGQVPVSAKAYRALALMQQAGVRIADGKTKEAVTLFDQAADTAPKGQIGELIADAARLKSAFALMDQSTYPEIEARLKPLTEENRPYRAEAREALALAKVQAGKLKEARQDFIVISLMNEAPEGLKNRARTTAQMIDAGLLTAVPEVVKAAGALPAPNAGPPQMSIPGLEGLIAQPPAQQAPGQGAPQ